MLCPLPEDDWEGFKSNNQLNSLSSSAVGGSLLLGILKKNKNNKKSLLMDDGQMVLVVEFFSPLGFAFYTKTSVGGSIRRQRGVTL